MADENGRLKRNRKAIYSLIFGILSFLYAYILCGSSWRSLGFFESSILVPLLIGFFLGGFAIFLGYTSIRNIRHSQGLLKGKVKSIFGIVLGGVSSLFLVLPGAVTLTYSIANPPNYELVLQLRETPTQKITPSILERTENILSSRLRRLGVPHETEKVSPDKINLRLRITETFNKERLQTVLNAGLLSFHLVHPESERRENQLSASDFKVPQGFKVVISGKRYLLIRIEPEMVDGVESAEVLSGEGSEPYISLKLGYEAADLFERITRDHVNQRLAIILDEKCCSAPVIQERIRGGHVAIRGDFTRGEAADIAAILWSGTVPVPIRVMEGRDLE